MMNPTPIKLEHMRPALRKPSYGSLTILTVERLFKDVRGEMFDSAGHEWHCDQFWPVLKQTDVIASHARLWDIMAGIERSPDDKYALAGVDHVDYGRFEVLAPMRYALIGVPKTPADELMESGMYQSSWESLPE